MKIQQFLNLFDFDRSFHNALNLSFYKNYVDIDVSIIKGMCNSLHFNNNSCMLHIPSSTE